MDYELFHSVADELTQAGDTPFQDPGRHPPPPGVKDRDGPAPGVSKVDRDAIRHRHGQGKVVSGGAVAVHAVQQQQPIARRSEVSGDPGPVDLPRGGQGAGAEGPPEEVPAIQHLDRRGGTGEAQIEAWGLSPRRNARPESEPFGPGREFEPRGEA